MKEFILVIITTVIVVVIWVGAEMENIAQQTFAPKDLLEISTPIDGTINTEYLEKLEIPAL